MTVPVEDFDQFVVPAFPVCRGGVIILGSLPTRAPSPTAQARPYLRVRVYSPWILLDASRTKKVPSGVSRSLSFTSSLGNGHGATDMSVLLHPTPRAHETHLCCSKKKNYLEMSPQYHSAS